MNFFFLFFIIFIIGCGYKPSSIYQDKIIGNNINAKIEINVKNPQETIFLKDALRDVLYSKNKDISSTNYDSVLKINSSSFSLSVLDYDENGFPYLYRAKVTLNITLIDKNKKSKNYYVSGSYDFSVSNNSIITDQAKLDAFKKASINALNKFFAILSKDGAENDN